MPAAAPRMPANVQNIYSTAAILLCSISSTRHSVMVFATSTGKGTRGLSMLAWNAASPLLAHPYCIIPQMVRGYGRSQDE